jgi:acetyl esterase/lipase
MRFVVSFSALVLSSVTFAAEPRIHRDLAYFEPKEQHRTLDVYTSTENKNQPIAFWIHGGGWQRGDKSDVAAKPWAFVDRGFVFVSTNYRFIPNVTMKQIAEDLAKAIRWTHHHAREYGGDPNTIFVMGHSAGASLAALICTDGSYLKAEGLSLTIIKGCVPVDGDAFDVPMQIKTESERGSKDTIRTFGDSVASQRDLSAVTHIGGGRNIPPFLILHVADPIPAAKRTGCCPETDIQSQRLAKALEEAGVQAKVYAARRKTHATLNSDLGLPGDEATKELFQFLDQTLHK